MTLSDIIVAAGFLLFAVWMTARGYHKGLMLKVLSIGSVVAALILELMLYPAIMDFISGLEPVQRVYAEIGKKILSGAFSGLLPEGGYSVSSPLYSALGLDTLAEGAGQKVGEVAAGVICFILIFIAIRIVARLLMAIAKGMRKIGLIRSLDGVGGAALGAIESLIYIWVLMLLLSAFPGYRISGVILSGIGRVGILGYLYEHNLVLLFFAGMIGAAI